MVASRLRSRASNEGARRAPRRPRETALGAQRLSPAAVEWAARNLARGVLPRTLIASLVEGGVPHTEAARGIAELSSSNVTRALLAALARGDRAREVASLQTDLRRRSGGIERLDQCPGAAELHARYWSTNTPFVVRGFVPRWARPAAWTFEQLRRRFGALEIEIAAGRDARSDPDVVFAELRTPTTLAAFLDIVEGSRANDAYLVARNRALADGPMSELLEEIEPPADLFDPATRRGGTSLWLGPAGTFTKLHHDATNNFFCQVIGHKRLRLVPPTVLDLVDGADGFYARSSAADVAASERGCVHDITLEPGDGLFLPVGWWHEVESLSPSLSLALVNFRWPNNFDYLPGRPR